MITHQFNHSAPALLTTAELAQELQVHEQTIYRWRSQGRIPSLRLSNKAIRYCLVDVLLALHGEDGLHGKNGSAEECGDA